MPTLEEQLTLGIKTDLNPMEASSYVSTNLNPAFALRPYQSEALARFRHLSSGDQQGATPTQLLFHMATGSGKTLIMAGCILHLYERGYRNFIFFVNSSTIIEKTRDNFLNATSSKYLFAQHITIAGQQVAIKEVANFQAVHADDINIVFTTIQGLHTRLNTPRENSITYEDLEDQQIVLISDEAHHINAETKKGRLNKEEAEAVLSWENTVTRIFNTHAANYLLEFTATADLQNPLVAAKYRDKIIFDYPLRQFRKDRYSKEVKVLQAELPPFQRALQAVLLSQYRRKLFERYGVHIKPVILFKSKTIAESHAFLEEFVRGVRSLTTKDLELIQGSNQGNVLAEAFAYFNQVGVPIPNLLAELKEDFSANKCIAVDSRSDSEEKQLIINSLEDKNNEYRAVFAVDKLNEGWDVLNLFDIVRLYNTRDTDHSSAKVGKTTMSEAQLIGRGARYCPFRLSSEQERYQRKYDEDPSNPLRVCEELYYHAAYNPKYISELNKALEQIGIKDSRPQGTSLSDKVQTKESAHTNKPGPADRTAAKELSKAIREKERRVKLTTGFSSITNAFESQPTQLPHAKPKTFHFKDFPLAIRRKAINRSNFYRFNNLQRYFPHLTSIHEFITSEKYLEPVKISFTGTAEQLNNPTAEMKLEASVKVLDEIAGEIQVG